MPCHPAPLSRPAGLDSTPAAAGIGLRQPHAAELMRRRPPLSFVEVHSENYFAAGGAALAVLDRVRADYPVSLHGVGLSLGSATGLEEGHLDQLAALVRRIRPCRVSDHASFARVAPGRSAPVWHGNDLLPVAFTPAALDLMAANVQRVQDRLGQAILVENLSTYLGWADNSLAEPDFFNQLARRTGCGVLLDVNNLVVNALNAGDDEAQAIRTACAWIDALAPKHVGEIHLAGYAELGDIVIDDHGSRVHPPVWTVYAHAVQKLGRVPTLIEWDTDLPALDVLLDEAALANAVQAQATEDSEALA
jgi:uncharacterized protein (UPF0276 family)